MTEVTYRCQTVNTPGPYSDCQRTDWKRHKHDCLRFCSNIKPNLENITDAQVPDIVRMLVDISMAVITVGEGREIYLSEEYKDKVRAMGQRVHNLGGLDLMKHVYRLLYSHLAQDRRMGVQNGTARHERETIPYCKSSILLRVSTAEMAADDVRRSWKVKGQS
eukprot:gene8288-biopygen18002